MWTREAKGIDDEACPSAISNGGPYSQEFRKEAVRYWLSSGHSLTIVATDLGVSEPCLRAWRRQLEAKDSAQDSQAKDSTPSTGGASSASELALAREIGQLRRHLEALTRQRDILKKAISTFSEDKTITGGTK